MAILVAPYQFLLSWTVLIQCFQSIIHLIYLANYVLCDHLHAHWCDRHISSAPQQFRCLIISDKIN